MVLNHVWGLLTAPRREWEAIREERCTVARCYTGHVLLLAAIPAVSAYVGATQVGWQTAAGQTMRLTSQSALPMALLFYLAMLTGVYTIGRMIHWMAGTYGARPRPADGVILAAHAATPLFMAGILALYPVVWLQMLLGYLAVGYAIYLLYTGVPIAMGIPRERGLLFATAIVTVGLVFVVALLAATVILWDIAVGPELAW
jgi:hypothetical protein